MFEGIKGMFAYASPVKDVLIQLGASPVSAKQTYYLHFPTAFYDGFTLSLQQVKTSFFRQLLGSELYCKCQFLDAVTNLYVHIFAPKLMEIPSHMQPKENLRVSKYGSISHLQLICEGIEQNAELTFDEETDHEISGIEPLDISCEHETKADDNFCKGLPRDPHASSSTCDFIWYRVVPFVSGYKNRSSQGRSLLKK